MAKLFLLVFRYALIFINFSLLNFQPASETEIKTFFAARIVFFLMLLIDYVHVAYYNNGVEKIIGFIGIFVAIAFAMIDSFGYLELLVLENVGNVYTIRGNADNFLLSIVKPFNAQTYVFISGLAVLIVLGLEGVNSGVRAVSSKIKTTRKEDAKADIKSTETA